VVVSIPEIPLCDWDSAFAAISEFDSTIPTSRVGTYKLLSVFDAFRYDEISTLTKQDISKHREQEK
jgi:hypothetical protein